MWINLSGYISRISLTWLVVLLSLPETSGQAGAKNSVQAQDSAKAESKSSRHSLFAGAGYGSNMIYLGSTISQDKPYGYGSLSYGFRGELYASFSSVHLSEVNPFLSFHIASLTYNHVFNSWFDISAGLYRYQVPASLADTLFSSFTYADLTLGFDWRLLYSKISAGGLFAGENQAYFQFRNSRYFKTPDFFKGKANISFDPYVDMLFGTLVEATTSTERMLMIPTPSRQWGRYWQSTSVTKYSKQLGLMEVDFGLPIAFNTDHMTIEAEPGYLLPVYDDPDYPGSKGFIFQLSAFFRIF